MSNIVVAILEFCSVSKKSLYILDFGFYSSFFHSLAFTFLKLSAHSKLSRLLTQICCEFSLRNDVERKHGTFLYILTNLKTFTGYLNQNSTLCVLQKYIPTYQMRLLTLQIADNIYTQQTHQSEYTYPQS